VAIIRDDLQEAIDNMLATPGPFLLECAILEDDNVLPITPPGMSVDEMMLDITV
jgi:acetolactate synthase-1/2/3 large subunit